MLLGNLSQSSDLLFSNYLLATWPPLDTPTELEIVLLGSRGPACLSHQRCLLWQGGWGGMLLPALRTAHMWPPDEENLQEYLLKDSNLSHSPKLGIVLKPVPRVLDNHPLQLGLQPIKSLCLPGIWHLVCAHFWKRLLTHSLWKQSYTQARGCWLGIYFGGHFVSDS